MNREALKTKLKEKFPILRSLYWKLRYPTGPVPFGIWLVNKIVQRIFRVNGDIPWMVHFTSSVTSGSKITIGEKVWVWLNGQLVVDNVTMENYWDREKPIYPTGAIELQNHGNTLYFKNIYVKELP